MVRRGRRFESARGLPTKTCKEALLSSRPSTGPRQQGSLGTGLGIGLWDPAHNVRARLLPPLKHISTPPAATGTSAALSLGNARRRVVHDRRRGGAYDRGRWGGGA